MEAVAEAVREAAAVAVAVAGDEPLARGSHGIASNTERRDDHESISKRTHLRAPAVRVDRARGRVVPARLRHAARDGGGRGRREGRHRAAVVRIADWPFAFPLVRAGQRWRFDTEAGKTEMLARRIGQNELSVINVMLAIVDAEREYASADRNKDGVREYTSKFKSAPGKQDGLYWATPEGQPPSPLGPLVSQAAGEGYAKMDGDAQRGDSAASLAAIGGAVPVTVVWGRADGVIPAAQAESVSGISNSVAM